MTAFDLMWPLALWLVIDKVLVPAKGQAADVNLLHLLGLAILGLILLKQIFDSIRMLESPGSTPSSSFACEIN